VTIDALDQLRALHETTGAAIGADVFSHPYPTYSPDPRKSQGIGAVDWYQDVVGLPGGEGYAAEGDDPEERERIERETWGGPNKESRRRSTAGDTKPTALESLLALEAILHPKEKKPDADLRKEFDGFMIALMLPPSAVSQLKDAACMDDIEDGAHCTVAYCHNKDDFQAAVRLAQSIARDVILPNLTTTRIGFFHGEKVVCYMGCASPDLDAFVSTLRHKMDAVGIAHDEDFPVFTPHITLKYLDGEPTPRELMAISTNASGQPPFQFTPELAVVDGGIRVDVDTNELALSEAVKTEDMKTKAATASKPKKPVGSTKTSTMEKHMTRAIFHSQQKRGQGASEAAKAGVGIAKWAMHAHGYSTGGPKATLTGKGVARNNHHTSEPSSTMLAKQREYDAITKIAGVK
jgi:hypothetical protein